MSWSQLNEEGVCFFFPIHCDKAGSAKINRPSIRYSSASHLLFRWLLRAMGYDLFLQTARGLFLSQRGAKAPLGRGSNAGFSVAVQKCSLGNSFNSVMKEIKTKLLRYIDLPHLRSGYSEGRVPHLAQANVVTRCQRSWPYQH